MATHYVVDVQTGTYFNAEHARLVSSMAYDIDEYNTVLDGDDDVQIAEIAEEFGSPVINNDARVLTRIANILSGQEWDSDTLCQVAELVRETGRHVAEVV